MNNNGAGFFVRSKAEKRSNTLCIASFDNEAVDEKDKPECSSYFGTVTKITKVVSTGDNKLATDIECAMTKAISVIGFCVTTVFKSAIIM